LRKREQKKGFGTEEQKYSVKEQHKKNILKQIQRGLANSAQISLRGTRILSKKRGAETR